MVTQGPSLARHSSSKTENSSSKKAVSDFSVFFRITFGKLTRDEISALLEAFQQQVETGGLYQEKCRICHDRARYLARQNLVLRNGQLVGRYTGADIKRLLSYHGRLSDEEQAVIYDMLVWQLETRQGQPAD